MAHKLTSNKSVIYNAQTLESSYLVITVPQTTFINQENNGPFGGGGDEHKVNINGAIFANYSSSAQQRIDGVNYTLTETEWDTFYASQSFQSPTSYDQVQEASLYYIQENIPVMFGLSSSNWIYTD
jgi:hypothetical protein